MPQGRFARYRRRFFLRFFTRRRRGLIAIQAPPVLVEELDIRTAEEVGFRNYL